MRVVLFVLVALGCAVPAAGARAQATHDDPSLSFAGADLLAGLAPGIDSFRPIGFSRTGLFASFEVGCGDEAGYRCYSVTVRDLVTDRVVDRIEATDEEPLQLIELGARARDLIAKHGIEAAGQRLGASFVAEQQFRVTLKTTPPPPSDVNGEAVQRTTVVSLVRDNNAVKRVGAMQESGFIDDDVPEVGAVFLSPFERRVAVVLIDKVYGGCIGKRWTVAVFGAELDARFTPPAASPR